MPWTCFLCRSGNNLHFHLLLTRTWIYIILVLSLCSTKQHISEQKSIWIHVVKYFRKKKNLKVLGCCWPLPLHTLSVMMAEYIVVQTDMNRGSTSLLKALCFNMQVGPWCLTTDNGIIQIYKLFSSIIVKYTCTFQVLFPSLFLRTGYLWVPAK